MRYVFAIVLSLLLQSVAYGWLSTRYPSGNMMQFVFIAFALCAIFYELSLKIWPVPYQAADLRAIQHIGIATIFSYITFFAAMAFIPASVVSLAEISVGPLFSALLSMALLKMQGGIVKNRQDFWAANVFFLATFMAAILIVRSTDVSLGDRVWGLSLSAIAGLAASVIALISLSQLNQVNPRLVLARRFRLTCLVALIFGLTFEHWNWTWAFWSSSAAIAFIGIVLPMYLMQLGIQKVRPMITMLALAFVPATTYLSESLFSGQFDVWVSGLIIAAVGFAIVYTLLEHYWFKRV